MDLEHVEAVARVLRDSARLTEIEVRDNGVTLRLRRPTPSEPVKPTAVPRSKATTPLSGQTTPAAPSSSPFVPVTAHLVGVFRAAQPTSIAPGDVLKEKQVLGYIEAMRLRNDCVAPVAGRVQAVLVQDGQPVEYGQSLFEIEP